MGNCRSRECIRSNFTAKLILQSGELREFTYPIKVSFLLQQSSDCFICSADEMEFGKIAAEVGGDEVLRPGEVYFELPVRRRSQRLRAEDMAALAVKASLALSGGGDDEERMMSCGCCAPRRVEPVVPPPFAADGGGGCGGKGGRTFVAKLSAIIEE